MNYKYHHTLDGIIINISASSKEGADEILSKIVQKPSDWTFYK